MRTRLFVPLMLLGVLISTCVHAQQATLVQTFALKEVFGVSHPDQIIDFDLTKPVDPKSAYVIGPNGDETPYQLIDGGKKLAVRTKLPACRYPVTLGGGYSPTRWKLQGMENYISINSELAVGDAVTFAGQALPTGISAGKEYFVVDVKRTDPSLFAAFSEKRGGEPVAITREGTDTTLTLLAVSADVAANRLYIRAHGLRDGDPVQFTTAGELPAPLSPKTIYRVRNADANSLQLSADGAKPGQLITVLNGGTGQHQLLIDWTWKLYAGRAPKAFTTGISGKKVGDYYEIVNGLTGMRIPVVPASLQNTPGPVQGVCLRDGTWTATGPNLLSMTAKTMTVKLLEQGPLKVVAEVRYTFDRPQKSYGERLISPAGEGYYSSTITIEAGQPSIEFIEDSDCDLSYSINLYAGIAPTQARYRGHHSNSKELGYEADGRQYRQFHERANMDAFVDYRYDVPRDYRKLAVWDPWIFDGGWYWQFYNDKAPVNANLAGIFAGPASQAIGSGWSGVNLYTAPQGITDLTSQLDAAGNLHTVFQSGRDLWYEKFDPQLAPGKLEKIAANVIRPDLLVREDGSIAVAGFDQGSGIFVRAERANGLFTAKPIAFNEAAELKPTEKDIYQASTSGTDYLFLFGTFKDQSGGLLFARKQGETSFTFQEALKDAAGFRQVVRPVFTRLPDGRVALVFTKGQYVEIGWLIPGKVTLNSTVANRVLHGNPATFLLNFGAAIDPQSGAVAVGNQAGVLNFIGSDGKLTPSGPLTSADHNGQGPNRRTLAVGADGTALFVQNGQLFQLSDGKWSDFAAGNATKLIGPRVHFNKATGQFLVLGRKDGMLTLYSWKPADAAPLLARQLPETDQRAMGLRMTMERGNDNPKGAFSPRIRFAWGLFTGTKGNDLANPYQVQPIARQMNVHAGINLQKIAHMQLDFPDPKRGFGSPFIDKSVVDAMLEKLRADKSGKYGGGFHQYLYNAEPYSRGLIDMWADPTGNENAKAIAGVMNTAHSLLDGYVNGDGIYDMHCHYWHGGLAMSSSGIWADQVLASKFASPEERTRMKAALALFGNILWDNDFVPMDNPAGVNMGTENMPVQQLGYRRFYAMMLGEHPTMQARAKAVTENTLETVRHIVNEFGAEIGCVHYIGASFEPTLTTLLQIKQLGKEDPFKTEPRLAKFADFYMNFQTPPEIRFGTNRKNISTGDGPTESSEMLGMMGTGLRDAHPELAAKAMWSWNIGGKPHSGFFGTTLLMIDENAPTKDPQLGNASFPGYYAVLRHGWGTQNETALWYMAGDFYRDHRHADRGEVVAYALGVPLALDWGSQYAPHVGGGFMHSAVLLESMVGQPWDQDVKNLGIGGTWGSSQQDAFTAFNTAAFSTGHMTSGNTTWRRSVYSIHPNEAYPILCIRDTFDGDQAAVPKVFTLNLMAEGAVQTPVGPVNPPVRTWGDGYNDKIKHEYPSAGQVFNLQPGLSRLAFTGVQFGTKDKPAIGIDWDLYTFSNEPQQAHIGNWADNWVGGASNDFQRLNGRLYEERQHILRIKGKGSFTTLILPYRKGEKRQDMQVTREGENFVITSKDDITTVNDNYYTFKSMQKQILATMSGQSASYEGLTVSGGPAEVIVEAKTLTLSASGKKGLRTITIPKGWKVSAPKECPVPVAVKDGTITFDYEGEAPLTLTLEKK
ncbi:MAG: hypothetical protein ACYDBB_25965 [Armatimonadota bacterium]